MQLEKLIEELKKYDKDAIVTVTDHGGGWSNVAKVEPDGSSVTITMDASRPFSSDN